MKMPLIYRWEARTLFIGPTTLLAPHSHAAAELVVSLKQPVRSQFGDKRSVVASALLIPPSITHQNYHQDEICPVLFLDAEGRDYKRLSGRFGVSKSVVSLGSLGHKLRLVMVRIIRERPAAKDTYRLIDKALFGQAEHMPVLDERVESAMRIIKSDLSIAVPAKDLADGVCLSTDRLLHLFKTEVGIPLRRYRSWLRLQEANRLIQLGHDMTYAAHQVGFVDSAHFSKAFRTQFGVSPTGMLARNLGASVQVG